MCQHGEIRGAWCRLLGFLREDWMRNKGVTQFCSICSLLRSGQPDLFGLYLLVQSKSSVQFYWEILQRSEPKGACEAAQAPPEHSPGSSTGLWHAAAAPKGSDELCCTGAPVLTRALVATTILSACECSNVCKTLLHLLPN